MPFGNLFSAHHQEDDAHPSQSAQSHQLHDSPHGRLQEMFFQLPTLGGRGHRHEPFEARKEREGRRSFETIPRRIASIPTEEEDEARIHDSWLACRVVHVEKPDPKKDLEVFRYAMCCTGTKLSQGNESSSTERVKKERSQSHSTAPLYSLERKILGGNKKLTRLDRKTINTILDGISIELKKTKDEPEFDLLYANALSTFERDLSRRVEEILDAKVTLPDLIGIFSDTLSRVQRGDSLASLDARVLRFENFLSSILKVKFGKFTSPSLEQLGAGDTNRIVQQLASSLSISKENEQLISHDTAFAQTQRGLYLDMSANLSMIDCHPYYNASSFPTREMLDAWKSQERRDVNGLLRKIDEAAYEALENHEREKRTRSEHLNNIRIRVIKARDLAGKGKNGKSDPYCTVEFEKDTFSTSVVPESLDPIWDEQVTLNLKEPKGKISIQVWDRNSEEDSRHLASKIFKDETDSFLGMLTFTVEEILQRGFGVWEQWFPLQKRSKRSHISGELYVSIQNLPSEVASAVVDQPTEPVPHHQLFKYLLKALLKKDYENDHSGGLSSPSQMILKEYGLRFRVDPFFQKVMYLGMLVELHESAGVDHSLLHNFFLDVAQLFRSEVPFTQDMRDVYERSIDILDRILFEHLLLYRDCFPFAKPANSIEMSIDILQTVYCDPFFIKRQKERKFLEFGREINPENFPTRLSFGLRESAVKYYDRMSEEAAPLQQNALVKLSQLVDLIMDNLDEDRDYFEKAFAVIPGLSISAINKREYVKFLSLEIKTQVLMDVETLDLPAIVEHLGFLSKLKEFLNDYVKPSVQSDPEELGNLQEQMSVDSWLHPLLMRWLVLVEDHLLQWIHKAIEVDQYEPMTKTVLHSTSVVDMFSAFDQSLKFLQTMCAGRSYEAAELTNRLGGIISRTIQSYSSLLFGKLVAQFQLLHHPPSPLSPFPPFIRPKAILPPFQVTLEHLVILNNLEAIRMNLADLYREIGVDDVMNTLRQHRAEEKGKGLKEQRQQMLRGSSRGGSFFGMGEKGERGEKGEEGVWGRLEVGVIKAQGLKGCNGNGLSDPYVLLLAGPSFGRILAKTRVIEKSLNPKWEEHFEVLLQGESELRVEVFDKDLFGSDDLCGDALLFLEEALLDSHSHDVWLELNPQGRILLRIKYELSKDQDIQFHFDYIERHLVRQEDDVIQLLIEQMAPFFLDCVMKIVCDAKGGFLKPNEGEVPLAEAQKALDPLIKYLEGNLSLLSEKLYAPINDRMATKTWKEILRAFKLTLVPTIGEDIFATFHNWFHQKKSHLLTPRQVSMLDRCLEVLLEFYSANGNGLDEEHLKNEKYEEVKWVMQLYKKPSDGLMKRYLQLVKSKPPTEEEAKRQWSEKETILQILQLRNEKEKETRRFVEDMLKELELEKKWGAHHRLSLK